MAIRFDDGRYYDSNKPKVAEPIFYKGIEFKSKLEATWAIVFDLYKAKWEYEQENIEYLDIPDDDNFYIPDFYLPDAIAQPNQTSKGVYIECKSIADLKNPRKWPTIYAKIEALVITTGKPCIIFPNQFRYIEEGYLYWKDTEGDVQKQEGSYDLFKAGDQFILTDPNFFELFSISAEEIRGARKLHLSIAGKFPSYYNKVKRRATQEKLEVQYDEERNTSEYLEHLECEEEANKLIKQLSWTDIDQIARENSWKTAKFKVQINKLTEEYELVDRIEEFYLCSWKKVEQLQTLIETYKIFKTALEKIGLPSDKVNCNTTQVPRIKNITSSLHKGAYSLDIRPPLGVYSF